MSQVELIHVPSEREATARRRDQHQLRPAMALVPFAEAMIRTGDLDPTYFALNGAEPLPWDQKARICLAYWCYYSLGAAALIAERGKTGKKYWELMKMAAQNTEPPPNAASGRWPRGAERRHFRGQQARLAVDDLQRKAETLSKSGSPEALVEWIAEGTTFAEVARRAKSLRGFGPWIGFKVADMCERVLDRPVDFADCALGIYKDPREGAALVRYGDWRKAISHAELAEIVNEHIELFQRHKAPPRRDRRINVQEVETILCKYKSHVKGSYRFGKDTQDLVASLRGWGRLAEALQASLQPVVEAVRKELARMDPAFGVRDL